MLKKCLLAIAVWYFVLSYGGGITAVGPFTTQAGCETTALRRPQRSAATVAPSPLSPASAPSSESA
jgi:hypothetical protein